MVRIALTLALAAAPGGLDDVRSHSEQIRLDMRYAGSRNFTGRRLPGYCEARALLLPDAARALARVQRRVRRGGLDLVVLDAYRPVRATKAMVRWAIRTGREELLGTYISRRSNHNRGAAVDLTLADAGSGRPLRMGTAYDSFTPRSHTRNARGRALRNRLRLERAAEAEGFANYRREWWHYDFPAPDAPARDFGMGC